VIEGLRNTYEDAIDKARNDMHAAARAIAEQVIPTRLLSDPQIFEHWVNEAVVLLKRSKTLQITYHPQYHDIMQQVAQKLPAGIALAADHTAQEYAFAINGDVGGIEFTWTSPLEQIEQPRPPTGFPT
jgi:flagellar biosynthesis/type III secretory pathway protein FliH